MQFSSKILKRFFPPFAAAISNWLAAFFLVSRPESLAWFMGQDA